MRRFILSVLAAAVLSCFAAAQTRAIPNHRENNDPAQHLSREVMHEMLMIPYYSVFDDLSFRVDGNTVTLMGAVIDPTIKSEAENRVKHIEGVDRVINNIEVLPVSPMDDQIRRAEYRAIFGEPTLSRYSMGAVPSIHIIVKNGRVTLTGYVNSAGDKNMAGVRANSVPNVFGVDNQLQLGD